MWLIEVRAGDEVNVSASGKSSSNCDLTDTGGTTTNFHDVDASVKCCEHCFKLFHRRSDEHLELRPWESLDLRAEKEAHRPLIADTVLVRGRRVVVGGVFVE